MRITNKIIQNNALTNINANKILQDKLNTQMATGKKNVNASDDPVVAIRALRLRSNATEISQYCKKNIPDAEEWLNNTEDALSSAVEVVTDMYEQVNKGTDSYLSSDNRDAILEQLKQLRDELYSSGNATYADRSLFTGYRTDMTLTFTEDTKKTYSMTEQLTKSSIDNITYVNTGSLSSVTESNYNAAGATKETDVTSSSLHRIRLAYDNLDTSAKVPLSDSTSTKNIVISYTDSGGTPHTLSTTTAADATAGYNMYNSTTGALSSGTDAVYIPETGEIILSDTAYATLQGLGSTSEIDVTYAKTDWEKYDLYPEHYMYCESTYTKTDSTTGILKYNAEYLTGNAAKQAISYDVGSNQTLQVNTTADECYTQDIGRDVEDLIDATQAVSDMEDVVEKLTAMLKDTSYDTAAVQSRLDAANKALDTLKEKMKSLYSSSISSMQGYLDTFNLAATKVGSRSSRLDLIESRLATQKTSIDTAVDNNENADLTEVAIDLSSAELSYSAALTATGKVIQTSLVDFI